MSFLHIDATQVVEILPQIRQKPAYSTWSISWLLMSWRRLSWSFDFKMESIVYHKMLSFQCVIYIRGGCVGFYRGDVRLLMEDIAELKPAVFPTVPRLLNRVYDKVSFLYTVYVCPADSWPPGPAIEPSTISSPVSGACVQGSKLRGAEGQNAPKLSPNAPRLLNLGAKFCYPIQPDICFEA